MDFCTAITTPKAAKPHRCTWCGEQILKGEVHHKWACTFEGTFSDNRLHAACFAAMQAAPRSLLEDGWERWEFKRGTHEHR